MTVIGKNTLTGSAAALNTDAALMLTKGNLAPILPANQELVSAHFGYGDVSGSGITTINAALYDITSGVSSAPKIAGTDVSFVIDNDDLSGDQWVSVTGLSVDLSAHAGKKLAILCASPNADGAGVVVEVSVGSDRSRSGAASTSAPATYTEASTSSSIFSLYAETQDISGGSSASVASTQTPQTTDLTASFTAPPGVVVGVQASQSSVLSSSSSAPAITTQALKNNTGSLLSNTGSIIANVYDISTGDLVVRKTGLTSDGSGVVTFSDALLSATTEYIVVLSIGVSDGVARITTS